MKKINTILIDDEEGALNTLKGMLYKFCPNVNILAEATTPADAIAQIERHKPDLLLMDIEMPPFGTSFDIINNIQMPHLGVIVITAYPQYAVDAINVIQPWAYLVKPFSIVKLQDALRIAERRIQANQNQAANKNARVSIVMENSRSSVIVDLEDIILCQADETFVCIFAERQGKIESIRSSKTLRDIEQELPADVFFRTHHSYIVNIHAIDRWERTGRNGIVYMKNNMKVPISVQKMPLFEEHLMAYFKQEGR